MPTVCEKINALESHVLTRQLRIAHALGEHFRADRPGDALSESGFVILNVGLAYFEMIEQFASGEASNGRSADFFKRGFNRVYPASGVSAADVNRIWKFIRNGMYHVAMPTDRCGLSRHLGCAFAAENGALVINPAQLIDDLAGIPILPPLHWRKASPSAPRLFPESPGPQHVDRVADGARDAK